MTSSAVTIATEHGCNKSHHGASSAYSAKNNSTPIFLYVIQFYMKNCTTTESLKKFSRADFLKLLRTVIFDWLEIRFKEFFLNLTKSFILGPHNPILK